MPERDDDVWDPLSATVGRRQSGGVVSRFFAIAGVLLAFAPVPVGTVLAIACGIVLWLKRRDFGPG